jgi:uncharacterized membrane protein
MEALKTNPVAVARMIVIGAVMLAYGWLAYQTARQPGPNLAGATLGFAPLAALAIWLSWRSTWRPFLLGLLVVGTILIGRHAHWLLLHYHWAYLIQHVGAMILFGVMFGRTLLPGQESLVTRFARLVHDSVSPQLAAYTRKVTWAWTLFFAMMTIVSLSLFAFAPLKIWALFANGLTPLLVIAMFVVEYLVRFRTLSAQDRVGPIQGVIAYTRYCAQATTASRAGNTPVDHAVQK